MERTLASRRAVHIGQSLVLAVVLLLAGCGKPATEITGVVSLDGQPVPNATLEFFPVSGKGRVSSTTSGLDGAYRVAVWPTKLSVVITATKVDGKVQDIYGPPGQMMDRIVNVLPERYGYQGRTPLTADPVEGKRTTVDFPLTSKP